MSTQNEAKTPVLIVGAGPTGLVLALSLSRRGAAFRIVDEKEGPGAHSRAMVVQARTLEFYRQFGFADEVIEGGVKVNAAHLREGGQHGSGREILRLRFADLGKHLSPYTFPLAYPQDDHERLLVKKLEETGVHVEWNTKVTSFEQNGEGVTATIIRNDATTEAINAGYICGCDGGHSVVREQLGIGFSGGTYPQLYYVADVRISRGFEPDLVMKSGGEEFCLAAASGFS